ncbi:MAG: SGNH/GDSL hydrolase family protein [Lachnospiraceae bacterium]|nr:SGNH/GDSL hydrolase family protein [Lachnospiraceae bacterium]
MKTKKWIRIVLTTIFVVGTLYLLQCLLVPKYASSVVEGNLIAEYYQEEMDHDVLFIGDCEVYENFVPAHLWEEYGINSFIRGSAQQLIWQSYYLLEDALRYETPDVVIFNVLALQYNEPQKEAYNRMSIEGMKWSMSKVGAIQSSMMEDENFLDYVFPILRYHSRITELGAEDFKYLFSRPKVSHNGYYMRVDSKPAVDVPGGKILGNYQFGDNAYAYMDKITQLCKENDIELILVKAPSLYPYWYEEWELQIEEYAAKHELTYINFLELQEECNLDFNVDTYDAGLHLNLWGALKITDYLGQVLTEDFGLTDRRNDEHLSQIWDEKLKIYYAEIERQKELYGVE